MDDFSPQTLTNSTYAIGLPPPLAGPRLASRPPPPTPPPHCPHKSAFSFSPTGLLCLELGSTWWGPGGLEGFVGVDAGRKAQVRAFADFAVGPHL